MNTNTNTCEKSVSEKQAIMKTIEKRTEKIVETGIKSGVLIIPSKNTCPKKKEESTQLLIDTMKAGANEFKEKTGKHMTYAEMREMYG